jgi:excisionase family DNA binding protein
MNSSVRLNADRSADPRTDVADLMCALVEAVAERAAELVRADLPSCEPEWPEWMSIETAARYLDVTADRLWKLKRGGSIPFVQDGRNARVFFGRADLDAWMGGKRC